VEQYTERKPGYCKRRKDDQEGCTQRNRKQDVERLKVDKADRAKEGRQAQDNPVYGSHDKVAAALPTISPGGGALILIESREYLVGVRLILKVHRPCGPQAP
jgi:hypothetical protein